MAAASGWRETIRVDKPCIFISYRTDDSWAAAKLIHQRLVPWFGADHVFLDVERIEAGDTWRDVLRRQLDQADVVLVVIGQKWLAAEDSTGRRRLDRDDDVVRWEVADALARGKRVIPVLIDSASLPKAEELPEPLKTLAGLNKRDLRNRSFDDDTDTLVQDLGGRGRLVDELLRLLRLLKSSVWLLPGIVLSVAMFLWVSLFDIAGLDTRMASATMALGDMISKNEPSDAVRLVAFQPDPKRPLELSARQDYARLIQALSRAGAARISFDLHFGKDSPSFDPPLVEAINAARNLGTQVIFGFSVLNGDTPRTLEALRPVVTLGFLCIQERLGEATGSLLVFKHGSQLFPGLALLAAKGPLQIENLATTEFKAREAAGASFSSAYSIRESYRRQPKCPAVADGDEAAVLNFPMTSIARLRDPQRRFTAQQVLNTHPEQLRPAFAGKTVLVGFETDDERKTTRLDWFGATRYGYEFHADAASALLKGDLVTVPGVWAQWAIMMVLAGLGLGLRLARFQNARTRWLCLLLAASACMVLSLGLYLNWRIQMNAMYQWAALLVAYWAFGLVEKRINREAEL